jgi:hypothetical protein
MSEVRNIKPSIYSVSYDDMVCIWIESMHPDDNVLVVWDAANHLDILKSSGFNLDEAAFYNNKVLTIIMDDVRDCFFVMDVLQRYDSQPFMQVYSGGRLLTDNLENLRTDLEELPN